MAYQSGEAEFCAHIIMHMLHMCQMAYQSGEAEFCAHIIMHMLHMCIAIIM